MQDGQLISLVAVVDYLVLKKEGLENGKREKQFE